MCFNSLCTMLFSWQTHNSTSISREILVVSIKDNQVYLTKQYSLDCDVRCLEKLWPLKKCLCYTMLLFYKIWLKIYSPCFSTRTTVHVRLQGTTYMMLLWPFLSWSRFHTYDCVLSFLRPFPFLGLSRRTAPPWPVVIVPPKDPKS